MDFTAPAAGFDIDRLRTRLSLPAAQPDVRFAGFTPAAVLVPVVVGGRVPGKVLLKDGVKAGDRIVTEGVGKLQAGAKIAEGAAKAAPAEAAAK